MDKKRSQLKRNGTKVEEVAFTNQIEYHSTFTARRGKGLTGKLFNLQPDYGKKIFSFSRSFSFIYNLMWADIQ
jgi:hypothetical protein